MHDKKENAKKKAERSSWIVFAFLRLWPRPFFDQRHPELTRARSEPQSRSQHSLFRPSRGWPEILQKTNPFRNVIIVISLLNKEFGDVFPRAIVQWYSNLLHVDGGYNRCCGSALQVTIGTTTCP